MKPLIIFGSGGHARVVIDTALKQDKYQILCLADDNRKMGEVAGKYMVVGNFEYVAEKYPDIHGIVALGDNYQREKAVERILKINPNFEFATIIHPDASISPSVKIGAGTVIMSGARISSDAKIGRQCLLQTMSNVGHDSRMFDFSALGAGTIIAASVDIWQGSSIEIGAVITREVSVGKYSLVGAGSVVLKNIPAHKLAYGVPARIIRDRKPEESPYG